jgi:hypothetical protein
MALIKRKSSRPVSLPSCIGGWNARDSLAAMSEVDAVVMVNWFPLTTEVMLRKGYTQYATGLPGQVESLFNYSGGSTRELFAVADGEIYNVTSGGAVGAAEVSGLTNSRWNYANISTAGGNFIIAANGLDKPLQYDGSAWTNPAITGVTDTLLKSPTLFKNRLFFIESGSLKSWYLPVNSIAGAASAVDLSSICKKGGFIVAHDNWTLDAGEGVDDYYVLVTSRGEIVIYQGTDPSSATTWALKGVWSMGEPVGDRCFYKIAGDILYISQDGLIPIAAALQSSRVNPRVAITDKIQFAVSESVTAYGGNFGWQTIYYPAENMLILNVPTQVGSNQEQYAMNTISKSWCRFTGWNANCWEIFNDRVYFGGNGYVALAWDGFVDDVSNIQGMCIQAFSAYGNPGLLKRWTMSKPIFRANGIPAVLQSISIDFNITENNAPLSFTPTTQASWDNALWDVAVWGGGYNIIQNWQGLTGIGYYGAPQIKVESQGIDVRWVSTDVIYEVGAVL